jgi:hypothetical protein
MGGLFSKPKTPEAPEKPKPIRMPVETDPAVLAAGERTKAAALQRKGRLSTILTDTARAVTGSSGQKLGA